MTRRLLHRDDVSSHPRRVWEYFCSWQGKADTGLWRRLGGRGSQSVSRACTIPEIGRKLNPRSRGSAHLAMPMRPRPKARESQLHLTIPTLHIDVHCTVQHGTLHTSPSPTYSQSIARCHRPPRLTPGPLMAPRCYERHSFSVSAGFPVPIGVPPQIPLRARPRQILPYFALTSQLGRKRRATAVHTDHPKRETELAWPSRSDPLHSNAGALLGRRNYFSSRLTPQGKTTTLHPILSRDPAQEVFTLSLRQLFGWFTIERLHTSYSTTASSPTNALATSGHCFGRSRVDSDPKKRGCALKY